MADGRQSSRAPVHRTGRAIRQRQDHPSRSDPGAHRRDHPAGNDRGKEHGRRRLARGARPSDERRGQHRRDRLHGRPADHSSTARARSNSPSRPRPILAGVDLAVVVAEADEKKIPALQVILKTLEDKGIPRILFLNKIDKADASVRADARDAAAGERRAAGAPPHPDLAERRRHRLHRPRARARLRLPRARGERNRRHERRGPRPRGRSPLRHARDARRLRRRADGAAPRGHPAAARQGVQATSSRRCAPARSARC